MLFSLGKSQQFLGCHNDGSKAFQIFISFLLRYLFTGSSLKAKGLPADSHNVMSDSPSIERKPSYEELEAENAHLRCRVAELETTVAALRRQVEELTRSAKRQAAPFSKGKAKKNPKRPGRKKGHPASHRPPPDSIDRIEDVPLPFHRCPDCGGAIEETDVHAQYQTDIPPIRQPPPGSIST